jgi:hypothetical protein
LLLAAAPVSAQAPTQRLSGIYSDLKYNTEAGDLNGMELLIVPRESGGAAALSAFVQISEGGAPYTAIVPVTVNGSQLDFTLPPGGMYGGMRFVGTIGPGELLVRWSSGQTEHLRRGKSYWQ